MSKQQEALRLALEALEAYGTKHAHTYGLDGAWDKEIMIGTLAVMSIREALDEQPAQEDPCPGCRKGGVCRTPKCGRLKLPVDHPLRSEQPAQQKCPTCNGNDADAPCAYPSEGQPGCLRDARLKPAQQQEPEPEPLTGETNVELGFYTNDASNGQQRKLVSAVEVGQLVGNRTNESASNLDPEGAIAVITGIDKCGCVSTCARDAAQQQDIPDLIAGALGVSRGTAYDLMRETLDGAQQQEPVQTTPNFEQLKQILDNLDRCHHRDSKQEFLRTWIRDWTEHKLTKHTSQPYEATPLASQRSVKPWRGLTNKDIYVCEPKTDWYDSVEFARAIEAKLMSKNGY